MCSSWFPPRERNPDDGRDDGRFETRDRVCPERATGAARLRIQKQVHSGEQRSHHEQDTAKTHQLSMGALRSARWSWPLV